MQGHSEVGLVKTSLAFYVQLVMFNWMAVREMSFALEGER
ncbi:hypothetical protein METHB2_200052 [Candidatus Methylobacter favarea]|uniref:Uncharacterized protein n=1 Tax=Candidatus Methylobacter favarea TaxID=2707345 RepID=A0A8S0W9Z9_9GAMM|nr:hypothetical protein METHB2_200052 [Candidatus Methylobacter favarea]